MIIGKNWKYALLEDGDIVKANDEWYKPQTDEWLPVDDGEMDDGYYPDAIIGYEYNHEEHKPIRRKYTDKVYEKYLKKREKKDKKIKKYLENK